MHKRNAQWDQSENFDSYITGCNARIAISSTKSALNIPYFLNMQKGLIAQRGIGFIGSAALGQIYVSYDTNDVLGYPIGINQALIDPKRYVKTNSSGSIAYLESNASIKAWIVDYEKTNTNLVTAATISTGNTNTYDENLNTNQTTLLTSTTATLFQADFAIQSVSELYSVTYLDGNECSNVTQLNIDGVWTTILTNAVNGVIQYQLSTTGWNLVTGVRIRGTTTAGFGRYHRVYEVTVF